MQRLRMGRAVGGPKAQVENNSLKRDPTQRGKPRGQPTALPNFPFLSQARLRCRFPLFALLRGVVMVIVIVAASCGHYLV